MSTVACCVPADRLTGWPAVTGLPFTVTVALLMLISRIPLKLFTGVSAAVWALRVARNCTAAGFVVVMPTFGRGTHWPGMVNGALVLVIEGRAPDDATSV